MFTLFLIQTIKKGELCDMSRVSCDMASRRDSPGNDATVTPGCDSLTTSELQNYHYYTQTLVLLSLLYCTHIPILHLCTVINKIRRQCLYSYLHPMSREPNKISGKFSTVKQQVEAQPEWREVTSIIVIVAQTLH